MPCLFMFINTFNHLNRKYQLYIWSLFRSLAPLSTQYYITMMVNLHSSLTLLVLTHLCLDFAYARPNTHTHMLARRDTITDSCSKEEKDALTTALREAKEMVRIL